MKKILCILLAALMIVPLFVACNNEEKPPVSTDDGTTDSTPADSESDDGTTELTHKVPVDTLDFGAEEFYTIAIDWQGYPHYFFAEEESSDPMESALYNRRRTVEDALNVTMTYYMYPDYVKFRDDINSDVTVGSTKIDMALTHCIDCLAVFTLNGALYPFEDLKYVDLSAPWWNAEQMENLRLGENSYYGVNDYMIPCPYVMFFNREMVEDMADMEDPYELVLSDKWTFDVFEEMVRKATLDLNTDGSFTYDQDSFGVSAHDDSDFCSFFTGFDQPIGAKGEDGKLTLAMNTEKTIDIFERFAELSKEHVFDASGVRGRDRIAFDTGRVLFYLTAIAYAEDLRDCEIDYGMIPFPKYDEEQESYKTLDWGGLMCVPSVVEDPDLVGAVIELLAFESKKEVIPTYYDIVLDGQLSRDPQTVKMLDIIFETICYEPVMTYWAFAKPLSTLFWALPFEAVAKQNGNFASLYASNGEAAQKQINDYYLTLETIEALNG